ncbi:MAG: hypothetical protein ACRCXT_02970, partial [Paraclostridium sp.]
MSLFGNINESIDMQLSEDSVSALTEAFILDELMRQPYDKRKEFVQSETASVLQERKVLGTKTVVRLSKDDD